MKDIYFDNAATSFPKPVEVAQQMYHFLVNIGTNVNRGLYDTSFSVAQTVMETRELLGAFFHFPQPENIIFTKNITESLNLVIKGLLQPGDHVLVSALEHNAVLRPLNLIPGLCVEKIPYCPENVLSPATTKKMLRPSTKAIILTHASNVCGTILPLKEIGQICHEKGIFFIIDSAQTAGFLDLNFEELKADALAFTGHKGLLGPMGIGGLLLTDRLAQELTPLMAGGTGSFSEAERQPSHLPDKFEAGTLNIPGIYGLNAALKYLAEQGLAKIQAQEINLTNHFLQKIKNIANLKIIGTSKISQKVPLVSLDFPGKDNGQIATLLAENYKIKTRCGLHCAPSAHKALGTFPQGTVRFSFNQFNTQAEIDYTLKILEKICRK